jgi:hypothetical protein
LNTGADELIEKGLRAAPTSEGLLKLKAELGGAGRMTFGGLRAEG